MIERGRPQIKIWRMRISRSVPNATNTLSQYVIYHIYSRNLRPPRILRTLILSHDFGFIFTLCIYSVLTDYRLLNRQ
jgi:hypothetical protein